MCLELHGENGWFSGIWSISFPLCSGEWDSEDKSDYTGTIRNPWREEASQSPPVAMIHLLRQLPTVSGTLSIVSLYP